MRIRPLVEQLEIRALPAVAFQSLPVLPFSDPAVLDNARVIFAHGQELGRRSDVFMKVGDSNTSTGDLAPQTFLVPLGEPGYNPFTSGLVANYPGLLSAWQVYQIPMDALGDNSFDRLSTAAYPGWNSAEALGHVGGEAALTDAAIAFVMIGTNDVFGSVSAATFRQNLEGIVSILTDEGVLPVLSTVPDAQYGGGEFSAQLRQFNQIIANVAAEHHIPLWNLWSEVTALPSEGLGSDLVHLNHSPNGAGAFNPADLLYGQNARNLEALQILDWFQTDVASGPTFIAPNATWQAMSDTSYLYAVGRDAGFSPTVDVYDVGTSKLVNRFLAFGASFGGGVQVATGDVNGDGFTDVICATGAGTTARVKVFSGKDGSLLASFTPFVSSYTGGLTVAVGDLDGDGVADLVVGQASGGSRVRVYEGGTFSPVSGFQAFPGMAGGVSVAVANVSGVGPVVAAASAGNPVVRLFDSDGSLVSSFHVFSGSGFGISIAAADLNGDGNDELAVAPLIDSSRVRIFDPVARSVLATFTVGPVLDPWTGIRLGTSANFRQRHVARG